MPEIDSKPIRPSNKLLPEYTFAYLRGEVATSGSWRMAGHNTLVRWHEDHIDVKLHGTIVAKLYEHSVAIYLGGYNTPTTIDRINRCIKSLGFEAQLTSTGQPYFCKWTPHNGSDENTAWWLQDGATVYDNGDVYFAPTKIDRL